MSSTKYLLYFILLHLTIAVPQINLYYTDWQNEITSNQTLQHNCLRIPTNFQIEFQDREIILYCLSESPSKFNAINDNNRFPNFTFTALAKQNITSEQLYLWSAPVDLVERYQFYLNELGTLSASLLAIDKFYNCTWPRFGPMCQYELNSYRSHYSSLDEIIDDTYRSHQLYPDTFPCYIHLQCNRGPYPSCLDWSEICDGKVDCLDSGLDEEYCSQLEINECKDDEYRCMNGQCIPQLFYRDQSAIPDCIDDSDRVLSALIDRLTDCYTGRSTLECEDVGCEGKQLDKFCMNTRNMRFWEALYSIKDDSVPKECWTALKCTFEVFLTEMSFCRSLCANNGCVTTILNTCPDMLYFPNVPVFFGDVYFAYSKRNVSSLASEKYPLSYVCYNKSRYDALFNMTSKVSFNNTTCFLPENVNFRDSHPNLWSGLSGVDLKILFTTLKKYHLIFNYTSALCDRSNMYQCMNSSKCISTHRFRDSYYDCPYMDDEIAIANNNIDTTEQLKQSYYKCQASNQYIHQALIENFRCDCGYIEPDWCEDEDLIYHHIRKTIVFKYICDGFLELMPIVIDGQNETDETECEQWECDNLYTHCNDVWNCLNGADEIGCSSSLSPLNCSANNHLCVSSQTNKLTCLPIEKANDGVVDCLGATDEPIRCRSKEINLNHESNFYCMNQTSQACVYYLNLCDDRQHCEHGDDEQFCDRNLTSSEKNVACDASAPRPRTAVEEFLCQHAGKIAKSRDTFIPLEQAMNTGLVKYVPENTRNKRESILSLMEMPNQHEPRCHRGVDLYVWLNKSATNTCLCPPSFYGDQCQYQNQRITLTIRFRVLSDSWRTQFAIVISLIDTSDQRLIHSFEQFSYLWKKNCRNKFHIYLLYSTRPKDLTKNYSIHIDFYEKLSLTVYRGSLLLPVDFLFLPIQRQAFFVDIPRTNDKLTQSCSDHQCIHGKCIRYSNNPQNLTFCQCERGWSGRYCTISHVCTCSSDSLCLGITVQNRSICVCPLNKFGPRCLITDTICQGGNNLTCQNGGRCIPNDGYMLLNQNFVCICPKGYSGDRCEIADNKLILSLNKDIILSQVLLIHFIKFTSPASSLLAFTKPPVRLSTFRLIPFGQNSVTIYWTQSFHLVFTELLNKHYYLTVFQNLYNRSAIINKTIDSADRCPNISELFNETFSQWHLLRRIKYYHLPCQNQSLNLSCFHDDVHFCLCYTFDRKRLSSCFNFDHNLTFNCFGGSECENEGQCFQDDRDCPTRSMCMCPSYFFGQRCQFSTSGFGVSLDAILGYHILPNVSFIHQPAIVQFGSSLTLIFMIAGLLNGILCLITFRNKSVREVGCGSYLFGSAVTTLFTMIMFAVKFLILLLAQMTVISNRLFLQVQCISLDFILRVCLTMDQWFNACVAVERAITAIKGVGFNKKKSQQAARFIIIILLLIIIGSCIHDPLNRHLIDEGTEDDDDVKRTWCIVRYSSTLQFYNSFMYTIHFCGPFLINLISSIVIIAKKSRQQSIVDKERSYQEILREQCQLHKHLLTAPVVLMILAVPRLIIASASRCMKSSDNDAWLFLIGYLISFLPPMLTFIIFIVPSKYYKKEFKKSFERYRKTIQRRFQLRSL